MLSVWLPAVTVAVEVRYRLLWTLKCTAKVVRTIGSRVCWLTIFFRCCGERHNARPSNAFDAPGGLMCWWLVHRRCRSSA